MITSTAIKERIIAAGAYAVGVAEIAPLPPSESDRYRRWIAQGMHAGMDYMARHLELRDDPSLLLPGATSIISCAFSYYSPLPEAYATASASTPVPDGGASGVLRWARYALGTDYHEVLRSRLGEVAAWITDQTGASCRVCVDTAPLRERYWAFRSGIGFIGLNDQLIIPGAGSYFFLGEILTTLPLKPDAPCTLTCGSCRACIKACPGHALIPTADSLGSSTIAPTPHSLADTATQPHAAPTSHPLADTGSKPHATPSLHPLADIGSQPHAAGDHHSFLDARKCLSYLTIEHRGDFPEGTAIGNHIYGCDICQEVCPHNVNPPVTKIPEFAPRPEILSLTREEILAMSQADFSRIFTHSAIKRTKLAGLHRNART